MLWHNSKNMQIAATYTDVHVNIPTSAAVFRWSMFWCVFTSDCRTPSNAMISVIDLSPVCDKVLRLQSKNSARYFCFTSGRVTNLLHHVQKTRKWIPVSSKVPKTIPKWKLPSTGWNTNYNRLIVYNFMGNWIIWQLSNWCKNCKLSTKHT